MVDDKIVASKRPQTALVTKAGASLEELGTNLWHSNRKSMRYSSQWCNYMKDTCAFRYQSARGHCLVALDYLDEGLSFLHEDVSKLYYAVIVLMMYDSAQPYTAITS